MNNSISLRLFILEISKIIRYELWYDYVKAKYRKNAKKYRQYYSLHKNIRYLLRHWKRC